MWWVCILKHTWSPSHLYRCVLLLFISQTMKRGAVLSEAFAGDISTGEVEALWAFYRLRNPGEPLAVVPEKSITSSLHRSHASAWWSIRWRASRAASLWVTSNHGIQVSTLLAHESGRMQLTNATIIFLNNKTDPTNIRTLCIYQWISSGCKGIDTSSFYCPIISTYMSSEDSSPEEH